MLNNIGVSKSRIASFCRRWKIRELSFFGSVLRADFRADSDVDIMVTFADNAEWSIFDHLRMEEELRALLGRDVDVITRKAIERSSNRVRREAILESAEPYYVAR
jgi:predicted nucleotidyltransferase